MIAHSSLTCPTCCFLIKQENGRIKMTDVPELTTSQEEADTKVFICCAHARDDGFSSICIFTVGSDIPLYALYFKEHIVHGYLCRI